MSRTPRHLVIGVLAAFAIVFVASGVWHMIEGAEVVRARLDRTERWLDGWRWVLIVIVIGGWRYWVQWLGAHLTPAARTGLIDARWRIAGWLVILELVLGQNLVGRAVEVLA